MTASDSDAVVRGAVGAALAIRADARPICVTYIADSLVTLLALSGRDTARVVVRLDGDVGPGGHTFWTNRIEYDFTRGSSSGSWRFIAQRALYFADGIVDDPSRAPPPTCLDGRR